MESILSFVGDVYQWDVCFVHPVQDEELESIALFMDLIYFGQIRLGGVDTLQTPSSQNVFEVKSY